MNAFIAKFTEQVLPYFNKELKREELNRKEPSHVKISEAVHQAKTLTPFNVKRISLKKLNFHSNRSIFRELIRII